MNRDAACTLGLGFLWLLSTGSVSCSDSMNANGRLAGGDIGPCPETEQSPLAWDESTELGVSPAEAFAAVEGRCSAPLRWDASGADTVEVVPAAGESEMSVELELDRESVRLTRFVVPDGAPRDPSCEPQIEAEARVHLSSGDGVFDVQGEVTLLFSEQGGVSSGQLSVDLEENEGSLEVELGDADSGRLGFAFEGADATRCVGELSFGTSRRQGNLGSSSQGRIGSWSSTGCGLGETKIDLDEPFAGTGDSVRDVILARFGELDEPGTWDDGSETELHVALEVPGESACAEDRAGARVLVPVRVTYGTRDGAIREHAIASGEQAEVRASAHAGGVPSLALWISEEQRCEDVDDSIDYTLEDCETLRGVEIQLGIDDYGDHRESSEGLRVYETHRNGDDEGGADAVRVLTLDAIADP